MPQVLPVVTWTSKGCYLLSLSQGHKNEAPSEDLTHYTVVMIKYTTSLTIVPYRGTWNVVHIGRSANILKKYRCYS